MALPRPLLLARSLHEVHPIFAITSITGHQSASGQSLILAHVHNTGGRAVDLNGTASLTGGSGGISAGSFPAQQIITLAPGQSGNVTFALDKHLSVGLWTAKVALVSGFTRSTASAAIEFSAAAAQRTGLPVTLWLAALVLAAALALALVAVFVARHSQRARREPA